MMNQASDEALHHEEAHGGGTDNQPSWDSAAALLESCIGQLDVSQDNENAGSSLGKTKTSHLASTS
jgi:hypothetical protein